MGKAPLICARVFCGKRESLSVPPVRVSIEVVQRAPAIGVRSRHLDADHGFGLAIRRVEIPIAEKEGEHIIDTRLEIHRKPVEKCPGRIGDVRAFQCISGSAGRQHLWIQTTNHGIGTTLKRGAQIRLGNDLRDDRTSR